MKSLWSNVAILIAIVILLFSMERICSDKQITAMKYERAATTDEINSLLSSQGYYIKFRLKDGKMSMVFPGSKRMIRKDRAHDVKMNKIYGGQ